MNREYHFGPFTLKPGQRALLRNSAPVALRPRAFDILLVLVENSGQPVPKRELLERGWLGEIVEENNLEQCISVLRKSLGERAKENRYIATVPGRGYQFVAPVSTVTTAAASPAGSTGRAALLVPIGALAVMALALACTGDKPVHGPSPGARVVTVIPFRNDSRQPDMAWLGTGLAEVLRSQIPSAPNLRVLFSDSAVGADALVSGAYAVNDKSARIDLKIVNSRTGKTIAGATETGPRAELLDLVVRLASRVRRELKASPPSPDRLFEGADSMRLYAEGVEALRGWQTARARDLLLQAVAASPANPFAWSALSEAWAILSREQESLEAARKAFALSGRLGPAERLEIEGRYRLASRDWSEAIRIYSGLFNMFPDSVDDGLALADVYIRATKGSQALATVARMRALPPPKSGDPRIDMTEARAYGALGDFSKVHEWASKARPHSLIV